jgi:cytochrome c peroxidase
MNVSVKQIAWLVCIFLFSLVLLSASNNAKSPEQKTLAYFNKYLDSLERKLIKYEAIATKAEAEELQRYFTDSRALYKRIEFLIEYYYPAAATRINGAPLLEAEASEPEEPTHPTGFQVLEEPVYEALSEESRLIIANEINGITAQVRKVKIYAKSQELTSAEVMDALKLNLYRMVAKSLTAFDCPGALSGINETAEVLSGLKEVLGYYAEDAAVNKALDAAIAYARNNSADFNGFDRAKFLTEYLNPVFKEFNRVQRSEQIPYNSEVRAVRVDANSFFDEGAFVSKYFAPTGAVADNEALIVLGGKLFYEPMISGTGKRSCGGCHEPSKAFTDGLAVNVSLLGDQQLMRNTPSLINAGLQPAQFADSRIAFLEDQVHDVVSNRQEMGGDFSKIVGRLRKSKEYETMFGAAFPNGDRWDQNNIKKAIAAYVRSLTALNSRFDKYMRGDKAAMTAQEVRGFNVYMGKAKCGTCHYVPLLSGAVPPLYDKIESEVLGVPATKDTVNAKVDSDLGKYNLYRMPHQKHSFKTPSLRNIAVTAPYMHNGVYTTLEEVIDFYNKGGGAGLGYELPNQTLAPDKLELTAMEKADLIAFLHALTDTVVGKGRVGY